MDFPYSFVAVEGNIGAGKTTFCRLMEERLGSHVILEAFDDNPFLPYFYEDPARYAFSVELFFMTERHKQLQNELAQRNLFQSLTVSDYLFTKTLLFARNNLGDEEFRLFQRLFTILQTSFPAPELIVYLHRPVPELLRNIQQRGRSYEQEIRADYLARIERAYFEYFRSLRGVPVLIVDVTDLQFWNDAREFNAIAELLSTTYSPGLHYLRPGVPTAPEAD